LREFYRFARAYELTTENPTRNLPSVRVEAGVPRPAPEDRFREALAAAEPDIRIMLLFGWTIGMRRGEIARAHMDDIAGRQMVVRGKGNRQRTLLIGDVLHQALAGRRDTHDWVFPSRKKPGAHVSEGVVGDLMSVALGQGVTAHMLRHRFATVAYGAERDLRAVQTLLGHSKPETTQVDVQVDDGALTAAMAAAAQL
jgi:integrase/recombinase XerC